MIKWGKEIRKAAAALRGDHGEEAESLDMLQKRATRWDAENLRKFSTWVMRGIRKGSHRAEGDRNMKRPCADRAGPGSSARHRRELINADFNVILGMIFQQRKTHRRVSEGSPARCLRSMPRTWPTGPLGALCRSGHRRRHPLRRLKGRGGVCGPGSILPQQPRHRADAAEVMREYAPKHSCSAPPPRVRRHGRVPIRETAPAGPQLQSLTGRSKYSSCSF